MEFSNDSMISVEEILADVVRECQDTNYRRRTKGWYVSQVKYGLQELEFDVEFNIKFMDELIPSVLRIPLPERGFNVRGVWVYNGGNFQPENAVRVYRKLDMMTNGGGDGYVSSNIAGMPDRFVQNSTSHSNDFYYGVQGGSIQLSDSCGSYAKVRVVYNSYTDDLSAPAIPVFVREALSMYGAMKFFESCMPENPRLYAPLYDRKYNSLYRPRVARLDSVWETAKRRMKKSSKDLRRTVMMYWGIPPEF